jgi:phenylacetate-CoA ligase
MASFSITGASQADSTALKSTGLRMRERASAAELRQMQDMALRNAVGHAVSSVPYYRDQFAAHRLAPDSIKTVQDLQRLPIVEKDDVRRTPERFWNARESGRYTINTSGTTGSPLRVRCNRRSLLRNYAHYYRLRERLGVGLRDRSATFAGRPIVEPDRSDPPFWRHNLASNNILYSTYHLSDANIPAYLERLAQQRPALIFSYPSALAAVSRVLLLHPELHIQPQAIITSCETLTPHQRVISEEAFGCPLTDYYGSAEMSAFVAQCARGTYHVWSTYGICEVLVGDRPARPVSPVTWSPQASSTMPCLSSGIVPGTWLYWEKAATVDSHFQRSIRSKVGGMTS